jgi:hypothetical protein
MTMIDLIEVIRSATALDATNEARAAGAQACHAILASLAPESTPAVTPTVEVSSHAQPPEAATSGAVPIDPAAIAQLAELAGALRGVPIDELLDLAIARLRNALPKDGAMSSVGGVRFQLVPVAMPPKRSVP